MTDQEWALTLFTYDTVTGQLRWKVRRGPLAPGDLAGSDNGLGYIRINFNGKLRLRSHLVWLIHTGKWPSLQLDHIDGESSNDRIENLREVTGIQNLRNQERPRSTNTTGFRGVHRNQEGKPYRANLCIGRKQIFLGNFDSAEEAHEVYKAARLRLYKGEF